MKVKGFNGVEAAIDLIDSMPLEEAMRIVWYEEYRHTEVEWFSDETGDEWSEEREVVDYEPEFCVEEPIGWANRHTSEKASGLGWTKEAFITLIRERREPNGFISNNREPVDFSERGNHNGWEWVRCTNVFFMCTTYLLYNEEKDILLSLWY